ncbi:DUF4145 domain-containing protein [Microbacterium resistens]|uniref:DUF4145 domain-containing protein n=1 Tax=Microbacterium resistens TaxID=156977 RepID=UPI00366E07CD
MSADGYGFDEQPEDESNSFVCPKCGDKSRYLEVPLLYSVRQAHNISYAHFNDDKEQSFTGNQLIEPDWAYRQWTASVCLGCRRSSVYRNGQLIYPSPTASTTPHPDLCDSARQLFVEATAVSALSPRAAAALARAAMETQLKHLLPGSSARDLQQRVGEVQKHVRPATWKLLTTLRVVGNDALHSGSDDTVALDLSGADTSLLDPLLGAINLLVEEMVTHPRTADEIYQKIPEAKRASAERAAERFTSAEEPTSPAT